MNKKIVLGFAAVLILALVGVGIFRQVNLKKTEKDVIRIGAILPLTGNLSYLGEEEKNALSLFVDSVNKNSNITLDIIFEDSRGTAKDGVAAYNKLKQLGIKNFFTSLTIVARSIAPLVDKNNDIQFVNSIDPKITSDYRNTFQIYYNIADEMKLAATFFKNNKVNKVAALYIETPEDELAVQQYLRGYLETNGIEFIGYDTYDFSDKSVKNQLLKLKSMNPDYIYTIDFGYMYPQMFKEAEELNIRKKIFGGLGMMTAPPMDSNLTNGIYFASASFAINPNSKSKYFMEKYYTKFNKSITFNGVYTYDGISVLFYLLKNGIEPNKIIGAKFEGFSGTIQITNTKSSIVEIVIATFNKNGVAIQIEN